MEDVKFCIVDSSDSHASKVELLRGIITEKLTIAAREILAVVENTIVGYDKEVLLLKHELEDHKRKLNATLQPDICPSISGENDEVDGNEDHNNEHARLKQEYEDSVEADIPSSDSSSVPCPTDPAPKHDARNEVQKVLIKKKRQHTHHPDIDSSAGAFGQQGPPDFFNNPWSTMPALPVNPEFEAFLSAYNQSSDYQPASSEMEVTKPVPMDDQNDTCFSSGSAAQSTEGLNCKVCGIDVGSKRILIEHVCNYHLNNPEGLCGVCGHHLETPEELKSHLDTHLKHLQCEKCGLYFVTYFSFQKHNVVCQTDQRPPADDTLLESSSRQTRKQGETVNVRCPFCDKQLKGKEIEHHMMVHTGEKPYICTECGKQFLSRGGLKKHLQIHLGVKPFSCTECDYKCSRSDHLKLHMSTHTGHKPHRCSLCDKAFTQSNNLKAHMRTHFSKLKK